MKPLIIFYTFCILTFYSALTFIGFRKEKHGNVKEGVLSEVFVTASVCKTTESKLLAQHFDDALTFLKQKQKNKAAEQIYDALMVFTVRTISSGNYCKKEFGLILKNLSASYIDLRLDRPIALTKVNEIFESAELFVAEDFILKSREHGKKSYSEAMRDINNAEESIALAARYSNRGEIEIEKKLFNSSVNLLMKIIHERTLGPTSSVLRRAKNILNNLEGPA